MTDLVAVTSGLLSLIAVAYFLLELHFTGLRRRLLAMLHSFGGQ